MNAYSQKQGSGIQGFKKKERETFSYCVPDGRKSCDNQPILPQSPRVLGLLSLEAGFLLYAVGVETPTHKSKLKPRASARPVSLHPDLGNLSKQTAPRPQQILHCRGIIPAILKPGEEYRVSASLCTLMSLPARASALAKGPFWQSFG